LNIAKIENADNIKIVAVSKTFPLSHVMPLIDHGHLHYGENKVQEADAKWTLIKKEKKNLQIHLIGKLQSNKAKKAVEVFDYIHSLDSQKLADILSKSEKEINKSINYFIQVNIGNEKQKSGIPYNEVDAFYNYCTKEKNMKILGLMAIPPNDNNKDKYFKSLSELNSSLALKDLSMGMSSDYMNALEHKATFLRIGSLIFGERS
jgi:pyridoxal phosphate enzyme (YggS family)